MASISFTCSDEEKALIKKIADDTVYGGMSGLCRYIVVAAVKAIDNARNGTQYEDIYPIGEEEDTVIYQVEKK